MACPTCDHTMSALVAGWWWCERCGTVLRDESVYLPKLVLRVRQLREVMERRVGFSSWDRKAWHEIGVDEAISRVGERPVHP